MRKILITFLALAGVALTVIASDACDSGIGFPIPREHLSGIVGANGSNETVPSGYAICESFNLGPNQFTYAQCEADPLYLGTSCVKCKFSTDMQSTPTKSSTKFLSVTNCSGQKEVGTCAVVNGIRHCHNPQVIMDPTTGLPATCSKGSYHTGLEQTKGD